MFSEVQPKGNCSSCAPVDAKAPVCPVRVNGGALTDYRPRCAVNAELVAMLNQQNVINSSYESRMFLQQNAEKLMEYNRTRAVDRLLPCAPCTRPFKEPGTMEPERYVVKCTPVSCERKEVNPGGIGDGRQY
jgi:hypothetical protein